MCPSLEGTGDNSVRQELRSMLYIAWLVPAGGEAMHFESA